MPNQREIAKALGVSNATVSMALRGDPTISTKMKERVREMAERMGYCPNAYVNVLMAQVRSGRKISDKGVIALLVDKASNQEWPGDGTYRLYLEGAIRRSGELGFHLECFFLRESGMEPRKTDSILHSRGIQGIIFAPPYRGNRAFPLRWDRYVCLGGSFSWEEQDFDLVAADQAYNIRQGFAKLTGLGYERIGMCMPLAFVEGHRRGTKWMAGYLEAQHFLSPKHRIPLFTGNFWDDDRVIFKKWLSKWKPDVLLSMRGHEKAWLDEMGIRIPEDMGLACYVRKDGDIWSGMDENSGVVGATAVEQLAGKIARNEYGLSEYPKQTLIEGRWVTGAMVRKQL